MKLVGDRIKETSTTTGTGDITLAGAATGFRTLASEYAIGEAFYYAIALGTEWETGLGTLSGSSTLVRSRVDKSSNADALVSFGAGTKEVFVTASAQFFYEMFQSLFASWRPPISW